MRTEKEKMIAGDFYLSGNDVEINAGLSRARSLLYKFNQSHPHDEELRYGIIKELFGKTPDLFLVETPFKCDHGFNISVGDYFFANFDCTMLDVAPITIGDRAYLGPKVGLYTANHPIDKDIRHEFYEFGSPITIGDDVWLGANTIVTPGVTIGSNVVIGAGSVVTKDIPNNVIAVGNPCKVLRPITDEDKAYWQTRKEEYQAELAEGNQKEEK